MATPEEIQRAIEAAQGGGSKTSDFEKIRRIFNSALLAGSISQDEYDAFLGSFNQIFNTMSTQGLSIQDAIKATAQNDNDLQEFFSSIVKAASDEDPNMTKLLLKQWETNTKERVKLAEQQAEIAATRQAKIDQQKSIAATGEFLGKFMAEGDEGTRWQREQQRLYAEGSGGTPTQAYEHPEAPEVSMESIMPWLERLAPNLRSFWSGRADEVLRGVQSVKNAWWKEVTQPAYDIGMAEQELRDAERGRESEHPRVGQPMDEARIGRWAGQTQRAKDAEQYLRDVSQQSAGYVAPPDPTANYLNTYDWMTKFLGNAPRQRGLYTSLSAPPARWRT